MSINEGHECGVCGRTDEAPHCPGCGDCLAALSALPEDVKDVFLGYPEFRAALSAPHPDRINIDFNNIQPDGSVDLVTPLIGVDGDETVRIVAVVVDWTTQSVNKEASDRADAMEDHLE